MLIIRHLLAGNLSAVLELLSPVETSVAPPVTHSDITLDDGVTAITLDDGTTHITTSY